jgi:TonB-dependent starch-binding outer membrane protein SusC
MGSCSILVHSYNLNRMNTFYRVFVAVLLFSVAAYGQQQQITGTVRDVAGNPLPGANVVIKGTTQGAITDVDGVYKLQAAPNAVLSISFIGYNTIDVDVNNRTQIDVTLEENAQTLKDVVVIGYGTKERKELTTAISSVSADEIKDMPVVSFDQALQGRAPGVQVVKNTGAPGGGVSIRIRGTGSFNGGQEPLYIVDGVAITNTSTGSFTVQDPTRNPNELGAGNYAGNEIVNGLAGVNIEDIESIDVLKDAASASIYGSRAANGVVIITTKRGREGKTRLNFNSYYGFQHMSNRYELLNAQQYVAMVNEAKIRQGQQIPFTEAPQHDTDWQDEIFQTAPMMNTNLSLSGGSKKTSYLMSLNYFKQDGIVINSGFDRYAFRTNLDHQLNDKVKIGSSLTLSRSTNKRLRNAGGANQLDAFNNNSTYGPSIIASALVANPALPVFDEEGAYSSDSLSIYANPVAQARTANLVSNTLLIIGNVFAEFEPIKNLKVRTSWSANIRDEFENFEFTQQPGLPGNGRIQFNNYSELLWSSENFVTYEFKPLKDLKLNLLGGFSLQEFDSRGANIDVTGVIGAGVNDIRAGTNVSAYSSGGGFWGMTSYFARTSANFRDKYLFEATARVDGSSRFGPNRQYGFFPSASVAWQLSEEPFMKAQSVISDAKIRASWGVTGNDQIDPWGWRASAIQLNGQYIGYKPIVPINIKNEDYSWERTIQTDIGINFGILNSRVQFIVDYYIKTSDQLFAYVPLPWTSGFDRALRNVGSIENRGFEFGVSGDVVRTRDFSWNASFNISFNRNKVINTFTGGDIVSGNYGYASVARPGKEISFQLYQVEDIDPATGRFRIKDLDGSGGEPTGGDLTIVASPLPDHFGGFNNNFKYKNFDLNLFFQWSYGNYIINNTRGEIQNNGKPDLSTIGPNLSAEALGRWTGPESNATFPVIDYNNRSGWGLPLDYNLEDASYLRLKTVAIGYTLPRELVSKARIDNARVYVSSNNLLTFTRYSGYDPEVNANGGMGGLQSNIGAGYDNGTYPQARTIVFGINLNF